MLRLPYDSLVSRKPVTCSLHFLRYSSRGATAFPGALKYLVLPLYSTQMGIVLQGTFSTNTKTVPACYVGSPRAHTGVRCFTISPEQVSVDTISCTLSQNVKHRQILYTCRIGRQVVINRPNSVGSSLDTKPWYAD